jgi:hypothetical protein
MAGQSQPPDTGSTLFSPDSRTSGGAERNSVGASRTAAVACGSPPGDFELSYQVYVMENAAIKVFLPEIASHLVEFS